MMSEEIHTQGLLVVDRFQACAAAPDDLEAARLCDAALARLDELLRAAGES
ncbi:hypothetical protein [Streptomyces sp. NBC_00091]|uniref:hypothetical protein n=1 Tax=Streptomyces sp. NBC_00091 TaxID=2975648 RepID=UPI00225B5A85|nr:hypothetical protein [Streptomyces sp. NBC_00091]MCX5381092.1 hypothetical protein [Streptomyces sp. NBC_00091]